MQRIQEFQHTTGQNGQFTIPKILLCNCINEDSSGNIWIGTVEVKGKGGLVKIDKNGKWSVFTTANSKLPWNTIEDIAIEGDIIWLGLNYGGVARFENNKWENYNLYNSIIPHDFVRSITIDKLGNKWIATLGGLVETNR